MGKVNEKLTPSDISTYYSIRAPKVRQAGRQWRGPCPLHDGNNDNFTVESETGMWTCHSKCGRGGDVVQFEEILSGLDTAAAISAVEDVICRKLEPLPAPLPPRPAGSIEAAYDYTDEDGKLLFQVIRYKPKRFNQRRKSPSGALKPWVYSIRECEIEMKDGTKQKLPACRIVPYRLKRVLTAEAVFVVEGEKDVTAIEDQGWTATCNPMGAGKWRDDFAQYFSGRRVVIIPDQDAFDTNPKVTEEHQFPGQRHGIAVARSLLKTAQAVRIVDLRGVKDVAEFFAAGGTAEALKEMITKAQVVDEEILAQREARLNLLSQSAPETPEPPAPQEPEPDLVTRFVPIEGGAPSPANNIALQILEEKDLMIDQSGSLYEYAAQGPYWHRHGDPKILQSWAMERAGLEQTAKLRREAADFIETAIRQIAVPWRSIDQYEVPLQNGVLDVRTNEIRPHRRSDYLETIMPVQYDKKAQCPTWLKSLEVWFQGDYQEQKVAALQEFFGYVLMAGHALYKKALYLYGPSNTGKSQVVSCAEALVGSRNVCSVSVESMDDSRKIAPIKGKLLNVMTELPSNAMIRDSGFKALISTGDSVTIDEKYIKAERYTPVAKHIFAANSLPVINDLTDATYNRILLIEFKNVISAGKQDRQLMDKFRGEVQGILNWALVGAKRLWNAGGEFTSIPESEKTISEYRTSQNPINDFLRESAIKVLDRDEQLEIYEIRRKFNEWVGHGKYSPFHIRRMLRSSGLYNTDEQCQFLFGYRWKTA
jgi:putative DNA primase/helicase